MQAEVGSEVKQKYCRLNIALRSYSQNPPLRLISPLLVVPRGVHSTLGGRTGRGVCGIVHSATAADTGVLSTCYLDIVGMMLREKYISNSNIGSNQQTFKMPAVHIIRWMLKTHHK